MICAFENNVLIISFLGALKERAKLKAIKGNRKNNKNGMKSVECIAISTDGKFLVIFNKNFF